MLCPLVSLIKKVVLVDLMDDRLVIESLGNQKSELQVMHVFNYHIDAFLDVSSQKEEPTTLLIVFLP